MRSLIRAFNLPESLAGAHLNCTAEPAHCQAGTFRIQQPLAPIVPERLDIPAYYPNAQFRRAWDVCLAANQL